LDDQQKIMDIMVDIYHDLPRQGPGSPDTTRKAFDLCGFDDAPQTILDIGCGTGTQTLTLAELTTGHVVGFDLLPDFINKFSSRINAQGLGNRVHAYVGDMNHLPVRQQSIDLVWAEGSAYSIGFENALKTWHPFLKQDGYIAVSEMVWTQANPPDEVTAFFAEEYPTMASVETRLQQVEESGYRIIENFIIPNSDWQAYYDPLEAKLPQMRDSYQGDDFASSLFDAFDVEIDMRRRFHAWYGYVFVVAQIV